MSDTLRAAAQQALDFIVATNKSSQFWLVPESNLNKTVTALRAALAAAVAEPVAFETRDDGKLVRVDRWEWGIRRIVAILWGNRREFEIDDVVDAVRALAPGKFADDESLVRVPWKRDMGQHPQQRPSVSR